MGAVGGGGRGFENLTNHFGVIQLLIVEVESLGVDGVVPLATDLLFQVLFTQIEQLSYAKSE